jgi:hypothetical protein
MRGRNFFTKEEFREAFPCVSANALQVALNRLMKSNSIMSPWQNFFVIMPIQYKLKGVVPPSYYIDELMRFLGRKYYVSLLSAAALNGAGHQRVMSFFVTAEGGPLRNGVKNGTKMLLFQRKHIDLRWVKQVRTEGGYMNVSVPLMTALDVVQNESKIGGLSRAAEVISELMEVIDLDNEAIPLMAEYSPAVVQRMGYLLGALDLPNAEDRLYELCQKMEMKFRYVKLKMSKDKADGDERCERWKVIVNEIVEIDEI